MLQHMELCRWLYNQLLKAKRENPNLKKYDTQRFIVKLKRENPKLNKVYSKVLQMVNPQLWSNLNALKELGRKGYKVGKLRYKTSPNSWKILNYNQSGFKLDEGRKRLHLSKIGEFPIKLHRRIKGKVKGVIIKRTKSGKWYAIFQVEEEPEPLLKTGKVVGIDLGVKHFVVDSEGNAFENPLFLENSLERIKKIQRQLSKKQKGSKNWEKARVKLAKAYERLYNQRRDFLHKLALYYVRNYDVIILEDLNAKNIVENGHTKGFRRRFLDSALKEFVRILSDKAGSASLNILKRGLDEGLGRPGLPVEGRPLPRIVPYRAIITGQVFLMKQEALPERMG